MYRQPARDDSQEGAPSEFVYEGRATEQRRGPALVVVQLFMIPLGIGVVLTAAVSPSAGIVGLVASAGLVFKWWRGSSETTVLRVEANELRVFSRRSKSAKKVIVTVPLRDLLNVVLDSKTIQRVTEGNSAIPVMRLVDSRVGPEVDVTRIALVLTEGRRVALSEEFLAYTETAETFGKMRVFLRKHGWIPVDERPGEEDASSPIA